MIWYVYWNAGRCNDGDHDWGLETCSTENKAREFVKSVMDRHFDAETVVIKGVEVSL